MDWKLVAWPVMGAMCLTLVVIHGVIWARHGGRHAHLALSGVLLAVIAISLITPLRALSPDADIALQPWAELTGAMLFVAMACFVHLEFESSRHWLFGAVVGARLGALVAGWLDGGVAVPVDPHSDWPLPAWGGPWPWDGRIGWAL